MNICTFYAVWLTVSSSDFLNLVFVLLFFWSFGCDTSELQLVLALRQLRLRELKSLANFTPPHSALMELGTVPGVQRSLCLTFWLASVPGGRLAVLDLLIVLWSGARAYRAV